MTTTTKTTISYLDQFKHARRVSVPLVGIETADPSATMKTLSKEYDADPIVVWDSLNGPRGLNDAGAAVVASMGDPLELSAPIPFLIAAERAPAKTIIGMYNAQDWLDQPVVRQGVWNLRDTFKRNGRTFILLAPVLELPLSLRNDVVVLDEPLPNEEELAAQVKTLDELATKGSKKNRPLTDEKTRSRVVEAVKGLPYFSSEQVISMALRGTGIDLDHCWVAKRKQVEQTKGLSIYRGGETFSDLGGLEQIKTYLTRIMTGRKPPKVVVWLDEIEKSGVAATGDTSGVNQDQEGTLLSFMEDHDVFGVMLLGVPGCGKSAICKAVGSEFDRVVIRIDLGAMQASLVGDSQQNIRAALKVVEAVGGNETMWLATSNSIDKLSGAMRSRFVDTMFFDLPPVEERKPIWDVWLRKYGLSGNGVNDDGWVARDIKHCCDKAWRMNISLAEAATYITPVGLIDREAIQALRRGADNRYLSASYPGVYKTPKNVQPERAFAL